MKLKLKDKVLNSLLFFLLAYFIVSFYSKAWFTISFDRSYDERTRALSKLTHSETPLTIIVDDNWDTEHYITYYYKYRKFGYDSSFIQLPVYYDIQLIPDPERINRKLIKCSISGNVITAVNINPFCLLSVSDRHKNEMKLNYLKMEISSIGRGYDKLLFNIPNKCLTVRNSFIYYNGERWIKLEPAKKRMNCNL